MLSEFQLIDRYFKRPAKAGGPVQLGIGDDCALIQAPSDELLAISTDMLIKADIFLLVLIPTNWVIKHWQ